MNCAVYQEQINETDGTKFHIPVVYYSTLMALVGCGGASMSR